jgi:hypothetical protein
VAFSPTSDTQARRRELFSLERMSLGWPWHEPKNAAGLACELVRWTTPSPVWAAGDAPEACAVDAANDAEEPVGGDPYRDAGTQRVCVDLPVVTDARFAIVHAMSFVAAYAKDGPIIVPADWGSPDEAAQTRLYWYAPELGKQAVAACQAAAEAIRFNAVEPTRRKAGGLEKFTTPSREITLLCNRWQAAGTAAQHAVEFLRKFATCNPTVGAVDGAGGGILNRISNTLAVNAAQPTEEITGRMFHWRVRDALRGKTLPPELDANLRPAFEAAWSAGEFSFAYSLLTDLDTLVESYA